jgi:P4 family phage/plasmid primase-like protien
MSDLHPLVLDIDIKYNDNITQHQYTQATIDKIVAFLRLNISDLLHLEEDNRLNEVWIMEKDKPYPCSVKNYSSKDGLHIAFPNIIIKKSTYRKIVNILTDQGVIESIFNETCAITPSNDDLLDGCFSGWQPYGCSKLNESPYILTTVYQLNDEKQLKKIDDELFQESYTNSLKIAKKLTMIGHINESITYTDALQNQLKPNSTSNSNNSNIMGNNDIYGGANVYYVDHNDVINPYELVDKYEKQLVIGLVKCLSPERSSEYSKWLAIGMCLHNINSENLDLWCEFSRQDPSYSRNTCEQKWKSFNNHGGEKIGIGSLRYWAKHDGGDKFYELMKEYLAEKIERSISHGPDAHHLIALVISKFLEDQYICVDINDDWYYFNGVRWKKTMKANKLKRAIHDDIHKIYSEYGKKYLDKCNKEEEGTTQYKIYYENYDKCLSFQKKLYQENYVNTIIGALKHIFYKENIMEEFDTDCSLIGFENGVYDLKNHLFREGRPEDYITLSTKVTLPINGPARPGEDSEKYRRRSIPDCSIPLDKLNTRVQEMMNFQALMDDMRAFLTQIIPDEELRDYAVRFCATCLSGENREESFNIWTGSGGNGKSKFVELNQLALGEYACNLPVSLLTQKRKASGAASPEMARTRGKRFVFMQEPDVNEVLNVGEMKEITGNDKIQARGLYKEPFEFVPQFKLLLMCNQLPKIPSNDDGTWRRLKAVPFVSRFVKPDKVDIRLNYHPIDNQLKKKLPYWIIPFTMILLKEWKEYDKNGIYVPRAVTAKTSDYRNSNDMVGKWIDTFCEEADNISEGVSNYAPSHGVDLWSEFEEWCKNELQEKIYPSKTEFLESLITWQEKSRYGWVCGNKLKDNKVNGSCIKPRFNIRVIS